MATAALRIYYLPGNPVEYDDVTFGAETAKEALEKAIFLGKEIQAQANRGDKIVWFEDKLDGSPKTPTFVRVDSIAQMVPRIWTH